MNLAMDYRMVLLLVVTTACTLVHGAGGPATEEEKQKDGTSPPSDDAAAVGDTQQPVAAQDDKLPEGDAPLEDDVLPPSGELQATKAGTAPTSNPVDYPGFSLYNGSSLCFRASFKAQLLVTYYTAGVGNTKLLGKTLDVPETATSGGKCGKQTTTFTLSWGDGNYSLAMDFVQKSQKGENVPAVTVATWVSDSIKFTFDTTANPAFEHIKTASKYTAETLQNDVHFEAPANFSYSCTTEEDMALYVLQNGTKDQSVIESVDLSFWDVKIQAFEVPQNGNFADSASCKPDIVKDVPHQNIVPLVVAACLAAVIIIIVIGYFIIKNRAETQYNAME